MYTYRDIQIQIIWFDVCNSFDVYFDISNYIKYLQYMYSMYTLGLSTTFCTTIEYFVQYTQHWYWVERYSKIDISNSLNWHSWWVSLLNSKSSEENFREKFCKFLKMIFIHTYILNSEIKSKRTYTITVAEDCVLVFKGKFQGQLTHSRHQELSWA